MAVEVQQPVHDVTRDFPVALLAVLPRLPGGRRRR